MDIWLDSTHIRMVKTALRMGILTGITTNPSLMAATGQEEQTVLAELLHIQEGPVTIQVMGENSQQMVQEGQNYYKFSNRLIIKVPVTKAGLEAIYLLSRQGIPTMATAIATPSQVLMSALAGADYVAPYLSRMEQAGEDPWASLASMQKILANYKLKTRILAASLKTVEHVVKCAEAGVYGVTISDPLFNELIDSHPLTAKWVTKFKEDACQKKTCSTV